MTFGESLAWSVLRSSLVAGGAVAAGRMIAAGLASMGPVERRAATALLAVPVLAPAVLIGYAYYNTPLSLIRWPIAHETWCAVLSWFRWTPVAAAMWALSPPPLMSAMAAHCRCLLRRNVPVRRRMRWRYGFVMQGPMRTAMLAFVVVFVLTMGDTEIGLMMNATGWGVWLFDAQAAGLELRQTLGYVIWPVAIMIAVIGAAGAVIATTGASGSTASARPAGDRRASSVMRSATWAQAIIAAAAVAVVPAAWVLRGTAEGLSVLIEQRPIVREIGVSLAFAACAAVAALIAADRLARLRGGVLRAGATALFCTPGLLGALTLSLVMVALMQADAIGSAAVYDTPVPLLAALALLLLPAAAAMRYAIDMTRPTPALCLAALLGASSEPPRRAWARRLRWLMHGRLTLAAAVVVFYLAYFELTASAILAPVAYTPATVRLYNFMHYGHPPALSAMLAMTTLIPIAIALTAWVIAAVCNRRALHG